MTIKPCSVSPGVAGRVVDRSHGEGKTRLVLGYEVIVAVRYPALKEPSADGAMAGVPAGSAVRGEELVGPNAVTAASDAAAMVVALAPINRRGQRLAAWLAPLSVRTGPLTPAVVEVVKR
ncbi:hypothetical protein [Micromonospora sp. NPDC005299]|uniref:hypothetical protein n=1 Tax=Micromonospora sp. NPDC005299 TaxID=3364231 RepID=UPI0036A10151